MIIEKTELNLLKKWEFKARVSCISDGKFVREGGEYLIRIGYDYKYGDLMCSVFGENGYLGNENVNKFCIPKFVVVVDKGELSYGN